MVEITIFGSLILAGGTILEKVILRKRKIDIKLYQVLSFLTIVLIMLPFIYFFWRMDAAALELKNIIIVGLVVILSLLANIFTFYSIKWEKITNIEPAKMMEPLFVIVLALIFSLFTEGMYAQNSKVIVPALLAACALIFSHLRKHHLNFNKYFVTAIFGSLFFATELILSRLVLDLYSPLTFYFIRCLSIAILSLIIFHPRLNRLDKKVRWEIFAAGAIWVVYRMIIYYGYVNLGVIFTTLMIMVGPVFIYLFAWKFLKEKLDWRNIVAAAVIIGSVLYALLA